MGASGNGADFTLARKATGALLFVVGAFLTILDVFRSDFDINVVVLVLLFAFGAALFGVSPPKIPGVGGDK